MNLKIPALDLPSQYRDLKDPLHAVLERLLTNGNFILGEECEAFEREVGEYLGVQYAMGVSSGTDALYLSLRALGTGRGDRVLTSPFTFFATVGSILNLGAVPVFADIDLDSYNLDPNAVESVLKKEKVRAMIVVHLYGQSAQMDDLSALSLRYGVPIIEDAAQAIGAHFGSQKVGGFGALGCFSFYPTKNLGALGDGGLVTTNDVVLARKIQLFKAHGASKKYHHDRLGSNCRLDALQAGFLRIFLPQLDGWIDARKQIAHHYNTHLSGLSDSLQTPKLVPGRDHTFHQYTIRVKDRDSLQAYLSEHGIGSTVYYPVACHQQKACVELNRSDPSFPKSEQACREVLSLPIYPAMPLAHQNQVIDGIRRWCEGVRAGKLK